MRWGNTDNVQKKPISSHALLVVAPCLLSEKLSLPSSSMVQALGGLWNGKTIMRDWPYCRGQIWVLNTKLGFCRKAFHIHHIEITSLMWSFCWSHTVGTAKGTVGREPCSHFLLTYLHMYHNRHEGPKACLGPWHCSQSTIHRPFQLKALRLSLSAFTVNSPHT